MHPPFGVLFSFPSRYYYAIGFRTYLELGVSVSHIHARYPTRTTLECTPTLQIYSYGTITLSGVLFQETSPSSALQLCASEHHISRINPGFSLLSAAFGRPYSRHRNCFLFLSLLRCFTSGSSFSFTGVYGMSHSGISGSQATCTSPELFAASHALHQRSEPSHPLNGCDA